MDVIAMSKQKYNEKVDIKFLENAIYWLDSSAKIRSGPIEKDVDHWELLLSLADLHRIRFENSGNPVDVDTLAHKHDNQVKEEAAKVQDNVFEGKALTGLAHSYLSKAKRSNVDTNVEQAISHLQKAVKLVPGNIESNVILCEAYAFQSSSLAKQKSNAESLKRILDSTIKLVQDAKKVQLSRHLCCFGFAYLALFRAFKDHELIQKAIKMYQEAVKVAPHNHPDKCNGYKGLGLAFVTKYNNAKGTEVGKHPIWANATSAFQSAATMEQGSPIDRIKAYHQWVKFSKRDWEIAYQGALDLLPLLVQFGHTRQQRYFNILCIGSLVNDAVTAALMGNRIPLAIEWFECGRAVVFNQTLELHSPKDKLPEDLKQRLERAAKALSRVNGFWGSSISEENRRSYRLLGAQYQQIVEQVRAKEDLKSYLKPRRYKELSNAASSGHVVLINVQETICHAIIMKKLSNGTVDLKQYPLGNIYKDFQKAYTSLTDWKEMPNTLKWLWEVVVNPILGVLGLQPVPDKNGRPDVENLPHITWCGSGPLVVLPLHAAGVYDDPQGPRLYQFAISSFSPTLGVLLTHVAQEEKGHNEMLAIGLDQDKEGKTNLPASETLNDIQQYIEKGKMTFKPLKDLNATVDNVVKALEGSEWLHICAHGTEGDQDPALGGIKMFDKLLMFHHLMGISFMNRGLAMLQSCQGARGKLTVRNEITSMAAGMLLCGYTSVVASLWSHLVLNSRMFTQAFYNNLLQLGGGKLDHRNAAKALHLAAHDFRIARKDVPQGSPTHPLKNEYGWASMIHIGIGPVKRFHKEPAQTKFQATPRGNVSKSMKRKK
ncbi:Protein kinase rad3 [Ceratobasidium theobromae]|uniref:Protein kinase rad3 n=1 Tax=Ceratobasidium theobromae TaxID=1582974 RepID=A0A5N5QEV3_9AGAM|nr:Protein kinase rad3 [Ceratobasidium theobromae]